MKFFYNPLTAKFEVKEDAASSSSNVTVTRNCDAGLNVGDFVLESLTTINFVEKCVDNTSIAPCIGVVESKPTATTCIVKQYGIQAGFSGLTMGKHVFLSVTGGVTNTAPATDYIQILGVATSATQVLINVQILRMKRA